MNKKNEIPPVRVIFQTYDNTGDKIAVIPFYTGPKARQRDEWMGI